MHHGSFRQDLLSKKEEYRDDSMKKSTIGTICIGVSLILLASFPRAIEVANRNFLFGFDQGKHWLAAKSIIVDHKLPLIGDEVGGGGGFFQGAGWYYMLAVPFFFFQGNPYGQLFLMFFIGITTVICSYFIFSYRFGKVAGFCISFLIALSPSIAIQSRFAWPPFVIPLITVFYIDALYCVYKGSFRSWFALFFLLGCMVHFEIATAVTLGLATCIVLFIMKKISMRSFGLGFLGGIIPLLPLLLFDFRHQFINMKGIWHMITTVSSGSETALLSKVFYDHVSIFSINLFGAFPLFPFRNVFILLCIGALAMILFDKQMKKEYKMFLASLCLIPCIVFTELLFYRAMLWEWWLLELPILYIVFVGLVSSYFYKKHILGKAFIVIFYIFLLSIAIPYTLEIWKKDYFDYGGTQKIKGKMEAIEAIYKDAKGEPFGVLVFTPPIYTYPYDYLFWWVGTKKYNYVPHKEKRGVFYLLIEPDGGKSWTYKGWLETVIKDGKIISSWQLPSGFIIEKRMTQ